MKQKIYLILAGLFLLSHQLKAQSPNALNYQGVARDGSGNTIPNQRISLRFTILQGSATGTSVYQETWTDTTNEFGLFTVAIGKGAEVGSNTFAGIDWSEGPYYLEVEMDPQGGANYFNMGTNQLLSVPYALYAANAGNGGVTYTAGNGISITGGVISADTSAAIWNANRLQGDSVSAIIPVAGQVLQWNDTAWTPTTQTVTTDSTLTGNGTVANALGIAQHGATNGQVLEWNGTAWVPTTVPGGSGAGWALTGNSGTTTGTDFIGTTDANDFVIKTNGTERMRVTSAGNIGINTTTPNDSSYLDIAGGAANNGTNPFTDVAPGPADIALQFSNGGGYRHFIASRHDNGATAGGNAIDFYINSGVGGANGSSAPGVGNIGAFTIENYGGHPRVGVGTIEFGTTLLTGPITDNSSVNGMLEVHAPTGSSDITLSTVDASTANAGGEIEFRGTGRGVTSGGNERLGQIENVYTGTSGLASRMTFYTNNGTTYTRAVDINSSQYVGIGEPAPVQRLEISTQLAGNSGNWNKGIPADTGAVQNGILRLEPSTEATGGFGEAVDFGYNVSTNGDYGWVQAENKTALQDHYAFVINPNGGNVGIGTKLPAQALDIEGGTRGTGNVQFSGALMPGGSAGTAGQVLQSNGVNAAPTWVTSSGGGGASGWALVGNSGTTAGINFIGTTDANDLVFKANGAEEMRIANSTGYVGIGEPAPGQRFVVAGNLTSSSGNWNKGVPADTGTVQNGIFRIGPSPEGGFGETLDFGYNVGPGSEDYAWVQSTNKDALNSKNPFVINPNGGDVGIGTKTPAQALDVEGGIRGTGNVQFSGALMPGGSAGTAGQVLQSNGANAAPTWVNAGGGGWSLTGNTATTPGTATGDNFIGTTDVEDFVFATNNVERMRITSGGNVGIGTNTPATDAGLGIKGLHLESLSGTTAPTITANGAAVASSSFTATGGATGGTDVGGGITITTVAVPIANGAPLVTINFAKAYTTSPSVVITPTDAASALAIQTNQVYVTSTINGFSINFGVAPPSGTTYNFNYFVIETK